MSDENKKSKELQKNIVLGIRSAKIEEKVYSKEKKRIKTRDNILLGVLLLLLIGISTINIMKGVPVMTFKGFLDLLANAPKIPMSWSIPNITIPEIFGLNIIFWGLNLSIDAFNVILFLLRSIANVIIWLMYFVGAIFA